MENLFKLKKPIIAMLHLKALPGDPLYDEKKCMDYVLECAKKDLLALQEGGVNGIMFSNEFSFPYRRQMDFVTIGAMAYVIGILKNELKLPFGVDCISDALATIELAAAVDADFVRGTFSGVYVGDGGLYNNDFSLTYRRKRALHLDNLKMFYFLNPESENPDVFCVSAKSAGADVDLNLIKAVKAKLPKSLCFCNTGAKKETIAEILKYSG